jgi:hypothetical protein
MGMHQEHMRGIGEGVKLGMQITHPELWAPLLKQGTVTFEMRDAATGKLLAYWEKDNRITLDAGILAARLFKNSLDPSPIQNNGLIMLGVGTGATGNILSPDAPQATQRKLNVEIARKAFASTQFRNAVGIAVSYPTHIVDFTTVFGEAEAVGPLNEMGLMCTASLNPLVSNPINNGPTNYDSTIDVTGKDILANYLPFSVVSKPPGAVLSITWRLTF